MNSNKEDREKEMIKYIDDQEKKIDALRNELIECKERLEDHSNDTDMLKILYESGFIDIDGNLINR